MRKRGMIPTPRLRVGLVLKPLVPLLAAIFIRPPKVKKGLTFRNSLCPSCRLHLYADPQFRDNAGFCDYRNATLSRILGDWLTDL